MCKPVMSYAWEIVDRWEHQQPVSHRPPIPESVVKAVKAACVVGWHLKWHSWVGAVGLSFYGAGRLGEVLRCLRSNLVFPRDLLEASYVPVFLKLRKFKV